MSALLTSEATQDQTTPPTAPAGRGRLRDICHRVLAAIREMNYASRRLVELQAPWSVDKQWHRK